MTAQAFFPGILGPDRHVVMISGGWGSYKTAIRVAEEFGTSNLTLLFTDTLIEHRDCYRLLLFTAADVFGVARERLGPALDRLARMPEFHQDAEARIDGLAQIRQMAKTVLPDLVWLVDGRDPWTVFFDERFLGNSRVDPCSKILKRLQADLWLSANRDPAVTTVYVGMDWTEAHRFAEAEARYARSGYRCRAPLCEAPLLPIDWKSHLAEEMAALGIEQPELYSLGFPHNNCGGFCIKAGQAFFSLLLRVLPEVYAYHEAREQEIRAVLGDVSILKDRRGGETRTLTLKDFRERVQAGGQFDKTAWGACGCFVAVGDEVAA